MIQKTEEKNRAVALRKEGLSYSEILRYIPVAKSTLALWLHSVGLSKKQKQRLTEKKLASIKRGWVAWRKKRIDISEHIKNSAKREIRNLNKRELLLVGAALYWAEGTKQKKHNISQGVSFNNSDPAMIRLFLKWLRVVLGVTTEDIKYEIYLHESSSKRVREVVRYWARQTGLGNKHFMRIYFKKGNVHTKRKNVGENYFGVLRVCLRKSTNINRRIAGWVEGIQIANIAGSSNR